MKKSIFLILQLLLTLVSLAQNPYTNYSNCLAGIDMSQKREVESLKCRYYTKHISSGSVNARKACEGMIEVNGDYWTCSLHNNYCSCNICDAKFDEEFKLLIFKFDQSRKNCEKQYESDKELEKQKIQKKQLELKEKLQKLDELNKTITKEHQKENSNIKNDSYSYWAYVYYMQSDGYGEKYLNKDGVEVQDGLWTVYVSDVIDLSTLNWESYPKILGGYSNNNSFSDHQRLNSCAKNYLLSRIPGVQNNGSNIDGTWCCPYEPHSYFTCDNLNFPNNGGLKNYKSKVEKCRTALLNAKGFTCIEVH